MSDSTTTFVKALTLSAAGAARCRDNLFELSLQVERTGARAASASRRTDHDHVWHRCLACSIRSRDYFRYFKQTCELSQCPA